MKIRQFPDSFKLSSWRTLEVTLPAHGQRDIGFYDTNPNIFMVNNPNEATLKFGISKMPTTNKYEYKINYSSSDVFGRPTGTGHLYVLNDSSIEVSFTLFSITMDFDPAIMKGTNVLIDLDNLETRAIIAGVNEGFKLPVDDAQTVAKLGEVVEALKSSGGGTKSEPMYLVEDIQLMTDNTTATTVVFDWLFNDGDDAVIIIGNISTQEEIRVFIIKKDEGFADLRFEVPEGCILAVYGENGNPNLRAKYHYET